MDAILRRGLFRDYKGFKNTAPRITHQLEKHMRHEMDIGMMRDTRDLDIHGHGSF